MFRYRQTPGALEYFDEMLQAPQKFKGGAFGMEILANPPPSLANKTLKRLEMGIDEVDNFRFDMFFEGSGNVKVWVETKNYASSTGFTTSFYNQFKAYISNPELKNLDELRYFFRANPGVTKESQVLKFKSMLKNNDVETLFNSNQNLFKTFDKANGNGKINIWEDLEDLFNSSNFNENHPFFTFIEVL